MLSSFSSVVLILVDLMFYGTLVSSSSSNSINVSQTSSGYFNATSYLNTTTDPNAAASTLAAATTSPYVTGSAAIESCLLEFEAFFSSDVEFFNSVNTLIGFSSITLSFETVTSTIYSTYTLCDGIPRIILDGPLNYTMVTSTVDYYTPTVVFSYESFLTPSPVIASTFITIEPVISFGYSYNSAAFQSRFNDQNQSLPTCQIDPSDCSSLFVASSNAMFTGGGINVTASPPLLACETVFDQFNADYPCSISIPIVQLIYWPVTLASQDLCVYPDPIDITAIQSGTPIASMFGRNFTSDENCYISYPIVIAQFNDDTEQTAPGGIITVPSSNLLSYRNSQYGYTNLFTYSFNFADLPPNHVPVLAYEGAADCSFDASEGFPQLDSSCATIYEALYTPQIAFPTELIDMFPQWASCDFNFAGLYDPPTSLVPVDFLTPPSNPNIQTTPASPGYTGESITPTQTPVLVTQEPSQIVEPPGTSAIAVESQLPSGGDIGDYTTVSDTNEDPNNGDSGNGNANGNANGNPDNGNANNGNANNGDSTINPDPPINTGTTPDTIVTFGNGGITVTPGAVVTLANGPGSVTLSVTNIGGVLVLGTTSLLPGQVATIDGQTVSALSQGIVVLQSGSPPAATAVFTLGDGDTVTATSIAGANGYVVVGSQTLTAGQVFTTGGAIVSVVDGGLYLSSFATTGAILTVNSETITAIESVNHGSTIFDVGTIGNVTVGGSAITLSNGVVLSAGTNGLIVTSSGGMITVSYSTITMAISTTSKNNTLSSPASTLTTPKSSTSSLSAAPIAVTSTTKKGSSSRSGIGMRVYIVWLLASLVLF